MKPAWRNEQVSLFMNTPVIHREMMLGFSDSNKGQYFALEPRTGKLLWTSAGRQAESAITLLADKLLVILTESGELIFANAAASGYSPLAKYQVAASSTFAHPVLVGRKILIKEQRHLVLWEIGL